MHLLFHLLVFLSQITFSIAFDNLAMATSHIPILTDWGKLSAKEQKRFNDEREIIEGEHKDKVLSAAKRLSQPQ